MDFRLTVKRYGPTVHLAPSGELDLDTGPALDGVRAEYRDADVVACDMRRLTFLDVAGLHALLGLAHRLEAYGTAFFAYNWQPQPRRLLDLVDQVELIEGPGRAGHRAAATRLLRRTLQDSATAARSARASRTRRTASPYR
ncbi:STAS domain-containing protein [Streptomyces sp. NPDC047014]|uniref:STAS domain-containing protein n=1 Tax=Streptomyces sp. NPDC047014 TaxID=3155736 RepID=UPI0033E1D048